MQVLNAEEVASWLKGFENVGVYSDYVHADKDGLFFAHPEASCIDLEYPAKLEKLPFFARCVATIGYEEHYFDGALIWVSSWGVWGAYSEVAGYRLVERINAATGQPKAFEAGPGHQFRADELVDTIGMLMLPMIFAWDSYYLPIWSFGVNEFFLHVSHDSYVTVITRTKTFYERVFQELEKLQLNPRPGGEQRVSRFCRPSETRG